MKNTSNVCSAKSAEGATPDKYNRCRSLAFPSAADLFDVQTSYPKNRLYDSPYGLPLLGVGLSALAVLNSSRFVEAPLTAANNSRQLEDCNYSPPFMGGVRGWVFITAYRTYSPSAWQH